jgi:hypothetical protein
MTHPHGIRKSHLLAQDDHEVEREEAAAAVALDVVLDPGVGDRARLEQGLELPEEPLDPEQVLVGERDLLGPPLGGVPQHGLAVVRRVLAHPAGINLDLASPDPEEAPITPVGDQPLDASRGELLLQRSQDLLPVLRVRDGFVVVQAHDVPAIVDLHPLDPEILADDAITPGPGQDLGPALQEPPHPHPHDVREALRGQRVQLRLRTVPRSQTTTTRSMAKRFRGSVAMPLSRVTRL